MILPTKRISSSRSILAIGGEILKLLNRPKSISLLWEEFKKTKGDGINSCYITYDWFILSLDLLYIIQTIKIESGRISKLT
jgi:hypothetical protein